MSDGARNALFGHIHGQKRAHDRLLRALENRRFAHAWLFTGPEGVGKGLTVEALARLLLCEAPVAGLPCGKCGACQMASLENHGDFIHLQPDDTKAGSTIGIGAVRAAQERLARTSGGAHAVLYIEAADRLTGEGANALLKTIEEPPAGVYVFLTSHNADALLATIRSRVQEVAFVPLSAQRLTELLAARHPELSEENLALAVRLAGGSLAEAERLLAPESLADEAREVRARLASLATVHPGEVLLWYQEAARGQGRALAERHLLYMENWAREALMAHIKGEPAHLPAAAARRALAEAAAVRQDLPTHVDPLLLLVRALLKTAQVWRETDSR